MIRPAALLKRSLVFVHRWIGVALSVIFLTWFASGIVMMYWGFPEVTAEDRLERLPALDPEQIKVSAAAARAALGDDASQGQPRLTSFDNRPAYRFGGRGGNAMVYADTGTAVELGDDAMSVDGVHGARLTGAGFGGCTVNLVRRDSIDAVSEAISTRYPARTGLTPRVFEVVPSPGARRLDGWR